MGAFLSDFVLVLAASAAVTLLFRWVGQPVVLGYLLVGLLLGPWGPGPLHVSDSSSVESIAQLGIVFLMFALGLEFNLGRLRKVGKAAVLGAVVEVALMLLLGFEMGRVLGWSPVDSLFLAAALSISSTTIIVKVLSEKGLVHEEFAQVALGILIVEDLLAVALVALLSAVAEGGFQPLSILLVSGRVLIFCATFVAVGIVLVPRFVDSVARLKSEEVLVLAIVGMASLSALLARTLGFSLALGSFLMGMVVSESRSVRSVVHGILPIRDLFTAIFFVAVGMLLDPQAFLSHPLLLLFISLVTIGAKVVSCFLGSILSGVEGRTSLKVAFSMGQIGEFSFVISALGVSSGVLESPLHSVVVAVCALTSLSTPYLISLSDPLSRKLPFLSRIGRMRETTLSGHPPLAGPQVRYLTRALLYSAWFLALFLGGGFLTRTLHEGALVPPSILGTEFGWTLPLLLLGILGAPLIVSFMRSMEEVSRELARRRSLAPSRISRLSPPPRLVARALAYGVGLALVVVSWGIASLLHPSTVPALTPWTLVAALLVWTTVSLLFRRSDRLYRWLEEAVDRAFEEEPSPSHPPFRRRFLPFGIETEEVRIEPSTWGAYSTLKDLGVRERTGATVLAIVRGPHAISNPHPETALLPGDLLLVMGKPRQIEGARALLGARGEFRPSAGNGGGAAPQPSDRSRIISSMLIREGRSSFNDPRGGPFEKG